MKQVNKTNVELLRLKEKHGFSIKTLADFIDCKTDTIKGYVCSPDSTRHRNVSPQTLQYFKLLLAMRKKA